MKRPRPRDPAPDLILASQSKGRAALLKAAGYRFRRIPSRIVEPAPPQGGHLERYVLRLACLKAEAVAIRHPGAIVIGADTALILDGAIIGKPGTLKEACRMLAKLGGRTHRISSAACVIFPADRTTGRRRTVRMVDTARVSLRKWDPGRIRAFVALTRPLKWAGAYAVQDPLSAAIVKQIEGDLATVIGLPARMVDRILEPQASPSSARQKGMKCCHPMPSILNSGF